MLESEFPDIWGVTSFPDLAFVNHFRRERESLHSWSLTFWLTGARQSLRWDRIFRPSTTGTGCHLQRADLYRYASKAYPATPFLSSLSPSHGPQHHIFHLGHYTNVLTCFSIPLSNLLPFESTIFSLRVSRQAIPFLKTPLMIFWLHAQRSQSLTMIYKSLKDQAPACLIKFISTPSSLLEFCHAVLNSRHLCLVDSHTTLSLTSLLPQNL